MNIFRVNSKVKTIGPVKNVGSIEIGTIGIISGIIHVPGGMNDVDHDFITVEFEDIFVNDKGIECKFWNVHREDIELVSFEELEELVIDLTKVPGKELFKEVKRRMKESAKWN